MLKDSVTVQGKVIRILEGVAAYLMNVALVNYTNYKITISRRSAGRPAKDINDSASGTGVTGSVPSCVSFLLSLSTGPSAGCPVDSTRGAVLGHSEGSKDMSGPSCRLT